MAGKIPDDMLTELAYLFGIEADLHAPLQFLTLATPAARAEAERLRFSAFGISLRRTKVLKADDVFDKIAARYSPPEQPMPIPVKKQEASPSTAAVPLLKWAGGKRQLLPEIRKHVPEKFGDYFEPFLGGGAVFFDLADQRRWKPFSRYVALSDINTELTATYQIVRDHVDQLIPVLREHEKKHSEAYYYALRDVSTVSKVATAARMIYLNRTGFNGLYRVNRKGGFNVPFGRYTNPTICNEEGLRACSKILKSASIKNADFETSAEHAIRGDFVYFDPPYVPASPTSDFTSFTPGGFGLAEQTRLAELARKLKKKGVDVLLSNADVPLVRKLYKGFKMRSIEARRNINSKGGKRGAVAELLIW